MTNTTNTSAPAAASGTFAIGGDLPVARLGFGTMRLPAGTFAGPARDPEDGIAVLRRAVELGVNHIDTASFYRRGGVVANELVRRALAPYPDGLVIATKVGPMLGPDGIHGAVALGRSVEAVLPLGRGGQGNAAEPGQDRPDLLGRQGMKNHDVVDAVDELGAKMLSYALHDGVLHALIVALARQFLNRLRAEV